MNIILDACAVIAYLRDEAGATVVENYLTNNEHTCIIHVVNLCEVYYDILRNASTTEADNMVEDLKAVGIIFSEDIDLSFWKTVASYKATIRRVSLAE